MRQVVRANNPWGWWPHVVGAHTSFLLSNITLIYVVPYFWFMVSSMIIIIFISHSGSTTERDDAINAGDCLCGRPYRDQASRTRRQDSFKCLLQWQQCSNIRVLLSEAVGLLAQSRYAPYCNAIDSNDRNIVLCIPIKTDAHRTFFVKINACILRDLSFDYMCVWCYAMVFHWWNKRKKNKYVIIWELHNDKHGFSIGNINELFDFILKVLRLLTAYVFARSFFCTLLLWKNTYALCLKTWLRFQQ